MRIYQYYNTNDDNDRDGYTANWMAQTFTPVDDHVIGKVKLKLFRVGDPGEITVSIKATVAGKPVGADLCSGVIQGTDLTDNTDGEWYEIAFGDGFNLDVGAVYGIVVKAPAGDASNKVSWRADITDPTFTGGTFLSSSDSGVDWSAVSGVDCMFEEWGVGPTSPGVVVWGNLYKSQISAEKIEEAIARLIQAHEDDPDAHVETGESLNSHKASAIIDHVASSIIADKIKEWEEIKVGGSFKRNDIHWFNVFDSLDGFAQAITGTGVVSITDSYIQLATGVGEYDDAWIAKTLGLMNSMSWSVKRSFKTRLVLTDVTEVAATWRIGDDDYYIGFAFFDNVGILGETDALYATSCKNGVETKVLIDDSPSAGTPDDYEVIFTPGVKAEYYINGVKVAEITTNLPDAEFHADILIACYIGNFEEVDKVMQLSYWDFWQEEWDPFA